MRLLLDTAALIHAVQAPHRLSKRVSALLEDSTNVLCLSAVSLSEIAIKTSLGKLGITIDIARQALVDLDIEVLPYTATHAFQLFALPLHHRDPFDRQIIAQAVSESLPVVSPDETFHLYEQLQVVW